MQDRDTNSKSTQGTLKPGLLYSADPDPSLEEMGEFEEIRSQ
jgi:hypothetical protein